MKQSLPTTLFYTLLPVLVNSIQSCGSNHNIELKEPTSIAPAGEVIPANNLTPNNAEQTTDAEQTTSPNPQEGEEYANGTAQQSPENLFASAPIPANDPTPNKAEPTTNAEPTTAPNPQESEECANGTAQQQKLKTLVEQLPEAVLRNINESLKQEQERKTAISSSKHAVELLETGKMSNSQMKILRGAVDKGAKNYLKDCDAHDRPAPRRFQDNLSLVRDKISKQLEEIEKVIKQIIAIDE